MRSNAIGLWVGVLLMAAATGCASPREQHAAVVEAPVTSARAPLPPAPSPAFEEVAAPEKVVCDGHTLKDKDRRDLEAAARQVMKAIDTSDATALARLTHSKKGLALGVLGTINYHLAPKDVEASFSDKTARDWDGRSNESDGPFKSSYSDYFASLRQSDYSHADAVGVDKVVQEDPLCGGTCVEEELASELRCDAFVQFAYPTESPHNSRMWHFLAVGMERDVDGKYHAVGLVEDEWSP